MSVCVCRSGACVCVCVAAGLQSSRRQGVELSADLGPRLSCLSLQHAPSTCHTHGHGARSAPGLAPRCATRKAPPTPKPQVKPPHLACNVSRCSKPVTSHLALGILQQRGQYPRRKSTALPHSSKAPSRSPIPFLTPPIATLHVATSTCWGPRASTYPFRAACSRTPHQLPSAHQRLGGGCVASVASAGTA